MEQYVTARQATGDDIIPCMRFARWIIKATDTHPEYVIVLLFHENSGYTMASQCYIVRTLSLVLIIITNKPVLQS